MDKIQENLDGLREQIASTNQSLLDQSHFGMAPAEQSAFTNNVVARLDLLSARGNRADQLRLLSPKVPRRFANLNNENPQSRILSPQAAPVSLQKGKPGQSHERNRSQHLEATQLMSNGHGE